MPRAPRLDVPGALHHVIARGIERSDVFHDDTDRTDFLNRIRVLFPETGTTLYAWSLLSNHWHMLVRSGPAGISRTMRRLLGGYVTTFNRRHPRIASSPPWWRRNPISSSCCATSTSTRYALASSQTSMP